ncbi:MAG: sigma-70 family RNA polymerase sigma factor [Candidatus Zixiibacteriota bacterium]
MSLQSQVTILLEKIGEGDGRAIDELLPLVYEQLKAIAANQLKKERPDHTLNTTALVHEAYLKLVHQDKASWENRAHFFAIAAQAMRRVLITYAKGRLAQKRGGGEAIVTFNEEVMSGDVRANELIALDEALTELNELSPRQGKIVELRFFGGLTEPEIAKLLKTSESTVKREWRLARAWLNREINQ